MPLIAIYKWCRPVLCDKPKLKPLTQMMSSEAAVLDEADKKIELTASPAGTDDFENLNKLIDRCVEHIVANEGWRAVYAFLSGLSRLHDEGPDGLEVHWVDTAQLRMWGHVVEAAGEAGCPGRNVVHYCKGWREVNGRRFEQDLRVDRADVEVIQR